MSPSSPRNLRTARPEDWPAYLMGRHVGEILGRSERTGQRKIKKGVCGPFFELDGTHYVRREIFRQTLQERERSPDPKRGKRHRYRRRRRV